MIGETLGHYRIVSQLGQGGMGAVYRARDEVLHRDVAVKLLTSRTIAAKSANDFLLEEARAVSALSHPNICTIHQVGETAAGPYIVMELVEGKFHCSSLLQRGFQAPEFVHEFQLGGHCSRHPWKQCVPHCVSCPLPRRPGLQCFIDQNSQQPAPKRSIGVEFWRLWARLPETRFHHFRRHSRVPQNAARHQEQRISPLPESLDKHDGVLQRSFRTRLMPVVILRFGMQCKCRAPIHLFTSTFP